MDEEVKDNEVQQTITKTRPSQAKAKLNYEGYKKCYHCNKYYELGTDHICFMVQRDKGKSRVKHDRKLKRSSDWF